MSVPFPLSSSRFIDCDLCVLFLGSNKRLDFVSFLVPFSLSLTWYLYQGSFFSNHCQRFLICYYVQSNCFFSIILHIHISKASSLFISSFPVAHVCDPYSMTLHSIGFYHLFLLIPV